MPVLLAGAETVVEDVDVAAPVAAKRRKESGERAAANMSCTGQAKYARQTPT